MANLVSTPIYIWFKLSVGILLVISATSAIIEITQGSRNKFACAIMCFTELYGIAYVGLALIHVLRQRKLAIVNDIALETVLYLVDIATV